MITDKVKKQIIDAMKAHDEVRLSTLKMLSSSLHNAKIAKIDDLTEEEEIALLPPYDRAKMALKKLDESRYLQKKAGPSWPCLSPNYLFVSNMSQLVHVAIQV